MADSAPPSKATDAVLLSSEPVPEDAQQVRGIDWTALPTESRSIIADFVLNLAGQGFQSSSIGDAIRIVNDMVCCAVDAVNRGSSDCSLSDNGKTAKLAMAPPSSSAIRQT